MSFNFDKWILFTQWYAAHCRQQTRPDGHPDSTAFQLLQTSNRIHKTNAASNPLCYFRKALFGITLIIGSTTLMANDMHLLSSLDEPRQHLEEYGITAEAILASDIMYNIDGGIKRDGTLLGNLDLTLEIDTEKAGLWKNGTFFIYGLGNFNTGKLLTEIVGDFQATSNIEADEAFKLYEA